MTGDNREQLLVAAIAALAVGTARRTSELWAALTLEWINDDGPAEGGPPEITIVEPVKSDAGLDGAVVRWSDGRTSLLTVIPTGHMLKEDDGG